MVSRKQNTHPLHLTALWREVLARQLGGLQINRLEKRSHSPTGATHISSAVACKKRRWFARLVIPIGNRISRLLGVRIDVLGDSAWHAREIRMHHALYEEEIGLTASGWLVVPWIADALSVTLAAPEISWQKKARGIQVSAKELRRLHDLACEHGRAFSHGDAGVRNIAFDDVSGEARWFDFEIQHRPEIPANWRHMDDLRAFVYSTLALIPEASFNGISLEIFQAYERSDSIRRLRDEVMSGRLSREIFHLAQIQVPPAKRILMDEAVVEAASIFLDAS